MNWKIKQRRFSRKKYKVEKFEKKYEDKGNSDKVYICICIYISFDLQEILDRMEIIEEEKDLEWFRIDQTSTQFQKL